jgi:hypothetical protein
MKTLFSTLFISVFCIFNCYAQQGILTRISPSNELAPFTTGYVNSSGDTIIPIGKYIYCFTEKFDKIAIVLPKNKKGYWAIDRNEKLLYEVKSIDNGPDYVMDGLFRIKMKNKIGYADVNGQVIIKPQFDFALPFKYGYAIVVYGGKNITDGEYQRRVGGKWGVINTSGEFIAKPIYDEIRYATNKDSMKVKINGLWSSIRVKL